MTQAWVTQEVEMGSGRSLGMRCPEQWADLQQDP